MVLTVEVGESHNIQNLEWEHRGKNSGGLDWSHSLFRDPRLVGAFSL